MLIQPSQTTLAEVARSAATESRIVLVVGERRTGKTTLARVLALAMARASGCRSGKPWGVSPDDQLGPRFRAVELDGAGANAMPSWAPSGVVPWRPQGVALIDEAQSVRGGGRARECMLALIERCGPRGLSLVVTSQRPAALNGALPGAARLFDWLIAGRIWFPADVEYLTQSCGVDATKLRDLPRHSFAVFKLCVE